MKLKTPIMIVNFKTYKESCGKNGLKLAKICEKIAKEKNKSIAVAVQPIDLKMIAYAVDIPVFAQHVDSIDYGSHTGHILAENVKDAGAVGSLLNHSEDLYNKDELEATSKKLKSLNMVRVICAVNPVKAKEAAKLNPEFIAIEPPELIGGDISISSAKPEIISDTVKSVEKINKKSIVLCGAGVNSKEDVKKALQLGSKGILIASAVVKAKNPYSVLKELVSEF